MEGTMSEIRLYAANFAPKYWAYCSGQLLNINTNQALFSLLGTTYGGNGITNFALPDFRGRAPVGTGTPSGASQFVLGQLSGTESTTALLSNLPLHTHTAAGTLTLKAYADTGDTAAPQNAYLASINNLYSDKTPDSALKPITPSVTVAVTGNSQPISIMQPYLGLSYIICMQGIYPSRN
ncbi:phage tail protein [Flavobacterium foetidum]|uniref:phage tail protein n=1 Tax=Flavobacterium foetidum TaxID=2026681 RepID=UPI001074BABE|nr:tail fiber protein [Flavobacterium foetidum]KAF2514951.1 phage tail protein [Flavobacterium foetidum]